MFNITSRGAHYNNESVDTSIDKNAKDLIKQRYTIITWG